MMMIGEKDVEEDKEFKKMIKLWVKTCSFFYWATFKLLQKVSPL